MLRYNNDFFGVVSLFIYISSNIPINSKLRYKKEDCWITEFEMVCLEGWPHRRVSTRQDCPRCTGKLSVIVSHWHKKDPSPTSKWHPKVAEWWNLRDKGTVWQMHRCTAFQLRSQQLSTQGDNCHQQRKPRHRLPEHISKRGLARALQVVRVHSLQALNLPSASMPDLG